MNFAIPENLADIPAFIDAQLEADPLFAIETLYELGFLGWMTTVDKAGKQGTLEVSPDFVMGLKMAELGSLKMQLAIAECYDSVAMFTDAAGDHETSKRYSSKAAEWYRIASERGCVSAQANLGSLYFTVKPTPDADMKAVYWLLKAAEKGNTLAQYYLGEIRSQGCDGVPKDELKAFEWYLRAARDGDSWFSELKAINTIDGMGLREVLERYCTAAEMGNNEVLFYIGAMHLLGKGVDKDELTAMAWFEKAALHGDIDAQIVLAGAYFHGKGVGEDLGKSIEYLRSAAWNGYTCVLLYLSFNLGCFARELNGEEAESLNGEAYAWMFVAAEQGGYNHVHLLFRVLPRSQIEAAKAMSVEFIEKINEVNLKRSV